MSLNIYGLRELRTNYIIKTYHVLLITVRLNYEFVIYLKKSHESFLIQIEFFKDEVN